MAKANINDRSSVEKIYSPDAWERDASRNVRGRATIRYGLKVLSEPDDGGMFHLAAASRHVGENDPEGDSIFIAAFEPDGAEVTTGPTYSGSHGRVPDANDDIDYARFIDRVIETARNAKFKPSIGKGDERLKNRG